MNEFDNFEVEFRLPKNLEEESESVAKAIVDLLIKTLVTLYPDEDYPENAMGVVSMVVIRQIMEKTENYVENLTLEDWGD